MKPILSLRIWGNLLWASFACVGLLPTAEAEFPGTLDPTAIASTREGATIAQALERVSEDELHAHIQFLADDLLEGRGPASNGDKLTQLYLETQFRAMGLLPLQELKSYRHPFPMLGLQSTSDKEWKFQKNKQPVAPTFHSWDDYIAVAGKPQANNSVKDAEVVFVGYGIQAPEFQWDDFKNVDLRGKILLIMNNDPESSPDLFAGVRRLYYGRWDYKYESAAQQGAAGAIIIHTDHSAGYPFSVIQTSWSGEEFELKANSGHRLDLKAWMTEAATKRLVESAGFDLETLRQKAESRDFSPVPLGLTLSTEVQCEVRERETANVLAYLPGTSQDHCQGEFVVFMAHHDHLGIAATRDEKGDTIFNGAIDNGSGTAGLLTLARALTSSGYAPKRSVLFAAVGAEEQGLLGSKFMAENPPIPNGRIAALVNIDGLNFLGPTRDVQVIGFGKSSLDKLVAAAAQKQNRSVIPDREPSKGYYYRSDQFSLAKVGVPGVYLHSGYEVIGKPYGWGKAQLDAWTDRDYHQRSDEYHADWDLSGAVQDLQLLLEVGLEAGNAESMQTWNAGDEFELPRKRAIEAAKGQP